MDNLYELISAETMRHEISVILDYNNKTEQFGLALTNEEAAELVLAKNDSLKNYQRIEFGEGILQSIIYTFCDSQYIEPDIYAETLARLQDIFFRYKNESLDLLSDSELLTFMQEQFEGVCYGDLDYLEGTCLQIFCQAIRAGYDGFIASAGHNEYTEFDEVMRWDKDLYLQVLRELLSWD